MTTVNMVWIGDTLGPIHAACLRSFLRHGHDVVLHSYGRPHDTPDGVRLFDAGKLMKETEVEVFKRHNLLAYASDIYRYRIQREGMGLYVDCDVFCLEPFADEEYVFTWESGHLIANGILKIPHDSELLKRILKDSENPYFIPYWYSRRKKRKMALRKLLGFPKHVVKQEWGVIGPQLISYHIKQLELTHHAQSIDTYLNLNSQHVPLLYEEGLRVCDLITPRSIGLHLSSSVRPLKEIIPNTPLYEIVNS